MSYQARVGSLPYRVIAWLEQQGVGAEFSLSQLAEAVNGDTNTLLQNIEQAITGGSIVKRSLNGGGKPYRYSLSREQHPKFNPMEEPVPAGQASVVVELAAEQRVAPPAPAPASTLRCALWSDGTLEILRTAEQKEPITLSRDETRALVAYLDSISLERVAG